MAQVVSNSRGHLLTALDCSRHVLQCVSPHHVLDLAFPIFRDALQRRRWGTRLSSAFVGIYGASRRFVCLHRGSAKKNTTEPIKPSKATTRAQRGDIPRTELNVANVITERKKELWRWLIPPLFMCLTGLLPLLSGLSNLDCIPEARQRAHSPNATLHCRRKLPPNPAERH